MSEREVRGVRVRPTGYKSWERKYSLSDVEVLYRRGDWHNWRDMIHWLETQGERDNELTPGEVIAMTEDLRRLEDSGAEFTKDPRKAYEAMSSH